MRCNEWRYVNVGNLGKIVTGKTPKTSISTNYGGNVPFLTPSDDMSVKYIRATNKSLTEQGKHEVRKCILPANSICVSCIGSDLGKVIITTEETVSNQQINSIILDPDFYNKDFVYYSMLILGKELNYVSKTSTAVPIVNKTSFSNYCISVPSLETQQQIAKILSSFDDKIELNNKINDNLEQQAQAIFKSWFVDFEPFGGVMPSDWEVFDLESIATIDNGYSYKGKELQSSDIAMATIKNFDRNGGFKLDGFKEIVPSDKIRSSHYVEKFDILVAHTDLTQNADIIGNAELLLSTSKYNAIIASMDLVKVTSKENFNQFLLASLLKSESFKNHALGYVNGTTVLHLSKKALKEYSVYLPKDLSLLNNISSYFESVYLQIAINIEENQKLTQLRDALLPKLMSGEIDVSQIEI